MKDRRPLHKQHDIRAVDFVLNSLAGIFKHAVLSWVRVPSGFTGNARSCQAGVPVCKAERATRYPSGPEGLQPPSDAAGCESCPQRRQTERGGHSDRHPRGYQCDLRVRERLFDQAFNLSASLPACLPLFPLGFLSWVCLVALRAAIYPEIALRETMSRLYGSSAPNFSCCAIVLPMTAAGTPECAAAEIPASAAVTTWHDPRRKPSGRAGVQRRYIRTESLAPAPFPQARQRDLRRTHRDRQSLPVVIRRERNAILSPAQDRPAAARSRPSISRR